METVYSYEETPLLYARARSEIPKLCAELAGQLQGLLGATVRIPVEDSVPFEGLVCNMLHPAGPVAQVLAVPGAYASLLLRGPVPRSVCLEGNTRPVVVVDNANWLDSVVLQVGEVRKCHFHCNFVRVNCFEYCGATWTTCAWRLWRAGRAWRERWSRCVP